jgi:hypothetical protein
MYIIRYLTTEPVNKCLVDIVYATDKNIIKIYDIFIYPIINKTDNNGIITEIVDKQFKFSKELKEDYIKTMIQLLAKDLNDPIIDQKIKSNKTK